MNVTVQFKGLKQVQKRLEWAAGKVERGANRDALNKAAKPMLNAAKRNARAIEKTGTLRKSLKRKVKTNVRKGTVQVLIGPDRRVTSEDYGGTHIPANIAHLVEFGFQHKGGPRVEGEHFLEAAFDETKAEAIKIYHKEIGASVEKFIRRFKDKV